MEEKQNNRITELSDSEFLSFLYAERDRENSLNQYQGWNIWAILGALITVICAGYSVFKSDETSVDRLSVCYLTSGLISSLILLRPIILIVFSYITPRRSVDFKKLKPLLEVAPIPFLVWSIICSIIFSLFIPFFDKGHPINVVSVAWMIILVALVVAIVYVFRNGDKVVRSGIDGVVFLNLKFDTWYFSILGGALYVVCSSSFKLLKGTVVGFSDFELAICITVILLLSYLLTIVLKSLKKASKIDELIEEYVFKGFPKEMTFRLLRIHRMGNTVLESCIKEAVGVGSQMELFEQKKKQAEEIEKMFDSGRFDANVLNGQSNEIKDVLDYIGVCAEKCRVLMSRLSQIEKQVPELKDDDDYQILVKMIDVTLDKLLDIQKVVSSVVGKISQRIDNYHCERCGGLCAADCELRHKKMPLFFRIIGRIKHKLRNTKANRNRKKCFKK